MNHYLGGANLHAFAAADTIFLVNHVNTGFGILGDGPVLTGLHALAALDAHVGLRTGALRYNLNATVSLVKFLLKGLGACPDAFQARHALGILFHRELLHSRTTPLCFCNEGLSPYSIMEITK